jgi:hypothetical protein
MTIRDVDISARPISEDEYYEPPTVELNLAVIGDDVHLARVKLDSEENRTERAVPRRPGPVAAARSAGRYRGRRAQAT